MSFFPYNPNVGQRMQTDSDGVYIDRAFIAHLALSAAQAAAADTDAVHAAVTDTGVQQVVTTGITNPPYARNLTATAGGVATDIKDVQVIVEGTDLDGNVISETLPAFTLNTAGTVVGSKAFATVTSITLPAHDGLGATTAIGFGDKIGLPDQLSHDTVLAAYLNNVKEGTAPTVAVDAANVSGNTADLNSALNGTAVDLYYLV